MKYDRIIQKDKVKFYEIAENVFGAISPYNGICWANAAFINRGPGLVYDSFFDLFHAQEMMDVYREVSGKDHPAYLVNSHYNCDHTWGNKVFKDSCIIMHKEAAREHLTEPYDYWNNIVNIGKDAEGVSVGQRFLGNELYGFNLAGVEWIKPNMEIDSDMNIYLDDTLVQVLNVAPAHSDSDLMLWMPKEKVLFAGDIVFNGCGAYSDAGIRNWVNVLNRIIEELKPEVVVPGHGAICGLDFVIEQRDYLLNLVSEFNKYYDDDIDSMELAKKVDVSPYLHWISPERLYVSIDAMLKGKRGIKEGASWEVLPGKFAELRAHMEKRYGDKLPKWDPMSAWAE